MERFLTANYRQTNNRRSEMELQIGSLASKLQVFQLFSRSLIIDYRLLISKNRKYWCISRFLTANYRQTNNRRVEIELQIGRLASKLRVFQLFGRSLIIDYRLLISKNRKYWCSSGFLTANNRQTNYRWSEIELWIDSLSSKLQVFQLFSRSLIIDYRLLISKNRKYLHLLLQFEAVFLRFRNLWSQERIGNFWRGVW